MTKSTQTPAATAPPSPTEAENAEMRIGRIDDAHLAWFIAETEAADALRAWRDGTASDADIAFCSYVAALKREESAAQHLERLCKASEPGAPTLTQRMNEAMH